MNHELEHLDCIIGLGTMDINVALVASELYLNGYSDKLIFSGGIYLEKESTNTGDNFKFTKRLIENEKLNIKSCLVVCKPYDEKRVYPAFKKIMSEYEVIIYSEKISCEEYYKRNGNEWVNVLVGDVQRMKVFFEKG